MGDRGFEVLIGIVPEAGFGDVADLFEEDRAEFTKGHVEVDIGEVFARIAVKPFGADEQGKKILGLGDLYLQGLALKGEFAGAVCRLKVAA